MKSDALMTDFVRVRLSNTITPCNGSPFTRFNLIPRPSSTFESDMFVLCSARAVRVRENDPRYPPVVFKTSAISRINRPTERTSSSERLDITLIIFRSDRYCSCRIFSLTTRDAASCDKKDRKYANPVVSFVIL